MPRLTPFLRNWLAPAALLLVLAAVPAGISALVHPKKPAWSAPELQEGEVLLEDVQAWPAETFYWVDARSPEAHAAAHIPGAMLLNETAWSDLLYANIENFTSGRKLVVYCNSRQCDASKQVRERLLAEGIAQEVYVLHGGWDTWLAQQKGAAQ